MAGKEYTLPLGLDANPVVQGVRQISTALQDLNSVAQKGNESMRQGFADLNNAEKESVANLVKSTAAITDQAKAAKANTDQFKGFYTLLQDIAKQNPKSFSPEVLARYQGALGQVGKFMTDLGQKGAAAFSTTQIEKLDAKLKTATTDLQQFKTVLEFIRENAANLNSPGTDEFITNLTDIYKLLETIESGEPLDPIPDAAEKKVQSLIRQLRLMKDELARLDKDSPEFFELAKKATILEDKIGDVNQQLKLLGSDTSSVDALIQGAQGIVGAFVGVQGVIALVGGENEEMQETLVKLTAAMSVLQGVQQIGQLIDKNSALNIFLLKNLRLQQAAASTQAAVAEGAQTAATVALTTAEEGATVATLSFNAALAANPAGVILLAIGALVAALAIFGNSSEDAAEEQKKVADAMKEANAAAVELAKSYSQVYSDRADDALRAVALAEAQGKSESEIYQLKLKALAARRTEGVSILANLGMTEKDIKYNETLLQYRQEQLASLLALQTTNGEITEDDQKRADALKSQIDAIKAILGPAKDAQKQIADSQAQSDQIAAARQRQLYEDSLKSATALAEAKADLADKGSKKELDLQIAAINAARKESLADVNITSGERFKVNVEADQKIDDLRRQYRINLIKDSISAQQAIVNSSIEGSYQEYAAKLSILELQSDAELAAEGLSANRIKEIKTQLEKDKAELTKQYNEEARKSAANAEISDISATLARVEEGSAAELEIKKKLIDQQRILDIISAENSIDNEEELISKLQEIDAKALRAKQDLDKQYIKSYIQTNREIIDSEIALQNAILTAKANNPLTSEEDRFKAQQEIRKNELDSIEAYQDDLDFLYSLGLVNEDEYQKQMNELMAKGVLKRAEIAKAETENIRRFNLGRQILKSLGLNADDPAVKEFVNSFIGAIERAYSSLTQLVENKAQQQIDAIQRVIDALGEQISEQESIVEEQRDLAEKGLANDLANEQAKLDDFKKKQEEQVAAKEQAQKKLEEIRKQEAIIQSASIIAGNIETGVNMINAMSKIFKAHAGIPFVGIALAVGFGALMLSSFLAIKNAVAVATADTPKFKKGGGFKIDGPDHESGGVGLFSGGKKIAEYEGNEYLFAVNKGSTGKYLGLLEAINEDDPVAIVKEILGGVRMPDASVREVLSTQREVDVIKAKHAFSFDNPHLESIDGRLKKLESIDEKLTPGKTVTDYGDYVIEKEGNIERKIWKKRS